MNENGNEMEEYIQCDDGEISEQYRLTFWA